MKPLTRIAQAAIAEYLSPGDDAIDATAGNGHDTLFLAKQVGAAGHVWAFDVQQSALDNTAALLTDTYLQRVSLIRASHADLAAHMPRDRQGKISVLMFNLGYLPGGDKQIITQAASTRAALQAGLQFLKPGGLLSVLAYTGHPGGEEEAESVRQWLQQHAHALTPIPHTLPPVQPGAPQLFLLQRT